MEQEEAVHELIAVSLIFIMHDGAPAYFNINLSIYSYTAYQNRWTDREERNVFSLDRRIKILQIFEIGFLLHR